MTQEFISIPHLIPLMTLHQVSQKVTLSTTEASYVRQVDSRLILPPFMKDSVPMRSSLVSVLVLFGARWAFQPGIL